MILAEYITERLKTPFQWGVFDCILFTGSSAEIKTGKKYLPEITWTNEREAMRALKKEGGMAEIFAKRFTAISPSYATDGDIAIIGTRSYLFSGSNIACPGDNGLVFRNRMDAERAFHV